MARITADDIADRKAYTFFAKAAREAGQSVSSWMREHGIIGSAETSKIARHEVAMSALPMHVQESLNEHTDWNGEFPGGDNVASIVANGRVKPGSMPKRRRGRPRKHFIEGDAE